MVDVDLILRRIAALDEYLGRLREYAGIDAPSYGADWKTQRIVERTLQMAIETCADLGEHLISDRGLRAPEGYADIFRILGEAGLLPTDLVQHFEKMARFRNVVVHCYDRIDAAIVVGILKGNLEDFDLFKSSVTGFLRTST